MSGRNRSYSKGANRSIRTGGGGMVTADFGFFQRRYVDFKSSFSQPKFKRATPLPKRVAKACGTAKGLMGAEKARQRQSQEAKERHANDVPKGHKRIVRGEHTLDVPITQVQLGILLEKRLTHRALKNVPEWVIRFVLHGELPQ